MGKAGKVILSVRSNARGLAARPYSNVLLASDSAGWVLDEEAREMIKIFTGLGTPAYFTAYPLSSLRQCIHYTSFFSLAARGVFDTRHRISVDYFHGKPQQDPAFKEVFRAIQKNAARIHRMRLSYSGMEPFALEAGVPRERIFRIPIGINGFYFQAQTEQSKQAARKQLGLPSAAVLIGSFQKDGQGWGEGMEPKLVKGPDVLLQTLRILKKSVPELFVVLTGPARGYVKAGLEKESIPYRHFFLQHYAEIGKFFQAIDLYAVTSREEGGPKAILESMSSGVPIISTRVGQAIDLIEDGLNGLLVAVEDAEALARCAARVISDTALRAQLTKNGLVTASQNTYEAQRPLWREYLRGFVEET